MTQATTTLTRVLPHQDMLPGGWLSLASVFFDLIQCRARSARLSLGYVQHAGY